MSQVQENATEENPLNLAMRSDMTCGEAERHGSEKQITLGWKGEWKQQLSPAGMRSQMIWGYWAGHDHGQRAPKVGQQRMLGTAERAPERWG